MQISLHQSSGQNSVKARAIMKLADDRSRSIIWNAQRKAKIKYSFTKYCDTGVLRTELSSRYKLLLQYKRTIFQYSHQPSRVMIYLDHLARIEQSLETRFLWFLPLLYLIDWCKFCCLGGDVVKLFRLEKSRKNTKKICFHWLSLRHFR